MDHVPLEVQFMILERAHPDALYAAHQVQKSWRFYILEKDNRMRTGNLSEKRMLILKTKCRPAIKNPENLALLEKELKLTKPQMQKWILYIVKELLLKNMELDQVMTVETDKLHSFGAGLTNFNGRFNTVGRILKIVCRYTRDFYTILTQKEREEIDEALAGANSIAVYSYDDVSLDGLEDLADQMINTDFDVEHMSATFLQGIIIKYISILETFHAFYKAVGKSYQAVILAIIKFLERSR